MLRRYAEIALTIAVVALLLALVAGSVLGQPVLLGYVESGSMAPTLEEGDGFVAVPSAVAGEVQPGDVVVFRAQEFDGGGLTTHRVVDTTDGGYVTKGDANPFTDQDGDEPPVTDDQVVAKVLQIDGQVVRIPHLGTAVEAVRSATVAVATAITGALGLDVQTTGERIGSLLLATGIVLFLASLVADWRGGPSRTRRRSARPDDLIDTRKLAVVLLLIVLVPANLAMVAPSGTTQLTVDGSDVAQPDGVSPVDSVDAKFEARNDGLVTLLIVLEPATEGVRMDRQQLSLPSGRQATATASIPAPEPDTERTVAIAESRYLLLLPAPVLVWLHRASPVLAWGALNLLIGLGVLGLVGGLLGFDRVRLRDTSRGVPLTTVLWRWLR